ncbi:hypothetical protein Poly51_63080 [Rubripirellula tenax]|uniref:Uncharacterized protein n=1 Tax=Rubripirellula tenax TaxID=2528015 RepID=A0A5C6E7Z1_9BACT|nr:hypothetical protein [Rubripirellula tenax]TWU43586.1 hypothetical protein Poly51_63080 [Rubripirellula tenax]
MRSTASFFNVVVAVVPDGDDRNGYESIAMRFAHLICILTVTCVATFAQETLPFNDAFETAAKDSERSATHPDVETPVARMMSLAYTDGLPAFDRVEIYAVSSLQRDPFGDEESRPRARGRTFPVRPYGTQADIHAHATVTGKGCQDLRTAWQALAFDRHGGAFCHYPAYGLRFYRDNQLFFETTICWKCRNFYLPTYDNEQRRFESSWHGFANDENAGNLLALLQRLSPHPQLDEDRRNDG